MSSKGWVGQQIKRLENEWGSIAQDHLSISEHDGVFFAYGSEIGVLRLLREFRKNDDADVGYAERVRSHYFRLRVLKSGD